MAVALVNATALTRSLRRWNLWLTCGPPAQAASVPPLSSSRVRCG